MIDMLLQETGTGGDLTFNGRDINGCMGKENQPYLAQFGSASEEIADWWGNSLLVGDNEKILFFSQTEKTLRSTPLTSGGRLAIDQAMYADLQYLQTEGTTITITTVIVSNDRLDARININGQQFYYQWHPNAGFLQYQI